MSKDLQAGIEVMKEDMAKETVEGIAGGGALKVVMNGNQEVVKVQIKPEAVDPDDIAMLEDLFVAAANQAVEKSKALQQDSLSHLTGGMKLPNIPFL
ncbi:YbaB/EbfC family nucleoid-associated protein [Candidatus Sumerlaeota bacterium]|nr:YbaB/EbfC family nucleoid-associated protein [Candidatus Sumerlaeota bacterium]